jgi:hypothetical protein
MIPLPKALHFKAQTKALFPKISTSEMKDWLQGLSKFQNRLYNSKYGKQAEEWIGGVICEVAKAYSGAMCTKYSHKKWDQNSVIVRIPGTSTDKEEQSQVVILGSHIDSITQSGGYNAESRSPGADDDGKWDTFLHC